MRLALLAASLVLAAGGAGTAHAAGGSVPILEYHVIGDPPAGAPFPNLYLSVADFRAQMGWLAAHGYRAVTMGAVWRHWTQSAPLPGKPVVLTFDDGYPSDATVVRRLLRSYGWPGNLNLHIGNLVPAQVRRLIAAGWEIDAHTFDHRDLTTETPAELEHDVAGSRAWLRAVFGVPASFFCYPSGRYDATVIDAVERAGYDGAEAETPKAATLADRWALGRFEILRGTGAAGVASVVRR